jgi:hypothetical protein
VRIRAHVIEERRPYIEINSNEAFVSLSTTGGGAVTEDDLSIARQLHQAAARYLSDCERLHTAQSALKAPEVAES